MSNGGSGSDIQRRNRAGLVGILRNAGVYPNSAHSASPARMASSAGPSDGDEEESGMDCTLLDMIEQHRLWYQKEGRLVVLSSLPHMSLQDGVVVHPLILPRDYDARGTMRGDNSEQTVQHERGCARKGGVCTLSPGCTVMATEAFTLDIRSLRLIHPDESTAGTPSESERNERTIEMLRIESPHDGYVVSKINGYSYLAPGLPSTYTNPSEWTWRVACQPDGAFIRNGPELIADHVDTLPFGSFCKVTRKIVNSMGLNRLQIEAYFVDKKKDVGGQSPEADGEQSKESSEKEERESEEEQSTDASSFGMSKVSGWISEFLNPLR